MLDLRRLRLLSELARRGTIAEVARVVGYTPSAISQSLLQLEREAGVPLLERDGRRVRAFGEMVALLWAQGNQAGAIRLEELWNDLARTHLFSLLCGYPMNAFSRQNDVPPFSEVCTCHSRVLPAETPRERERTSSNQQHDQSHDHEEFDQRECGC